MPLDEVSLLITQKLENMASDPSPEVIRSKRKAISALFPYAVSLEQGEERRMVDAISCMASATRPCGFMWYRVMPFITAMFKKPIPPSLNWVLGLISPNVPWQTEPRDKTMVARRAAAAPVFSHPEIHWSVADELLHDAFIGSLWPRVPPGFSQRPEGAGEDITRQVRSLGDVEILTSYLLLAWSGWGAIDDQSGGLTEMLTSIQEDLGGIGTGRHRDDLIQRLDHSLEMLEYGIPERYGLGHHESIAKQTQYEELKRVLLEIDGEAANTLARMPPRLICFSILTPANTESHRTFVCALPLPCP